MTAYLLGDGGTLRLFNEGYVGILDWGRIAGTQFLFKTQKVCNEDRTSSWRYLAVP